MVNNEDTKANVNYLLSIDPNELTDFFEILEGHLALCDSLENISFQLNDVPRAKFKGQTYEDWKMGASYKRNKISASERRFRARVKELAFLRYGPRPCG